MQDLDINFPQRKIKKNYRSITGHFPSVKNNTSMSFESKLERAHFLSLEFDNEVISYQEQPQIEIFLNNKTQIYSADCYIKRTSDSIEKSSLVEVKYTNDLEKNKEKYAVKFEAAKVSSNILDLNFEIYTEQTHSELYLYNLDFLYRYKLNPIENTYEEQIMELVEKHNQISAYELVNLISKDIMKYPTISNCIWDLVCKEKLRSDLISNQLTMNSLVEIAYE